MDIILLFKMNYNKKILSLKIYVYKMDIILLFKMSYNKKF